LELLKGMTTLQSLLLGDTELTDAGLVRFKGLTAMTHFKLSDTQVTDAGLEHLKGLITLQGLDLVNTQLSNVGVEHLKDITDLLMLALIGTQVTQARASITWVSLRLTTVTRSKLSSQLLSDNQPLAASGRRSLSQVASVSTLPL